MKVHLRLDGTSRTLEGDTIAVSSSDNSQRILEQLARTLEVPADKMRHLVIDKHPDGVVVRPPAVFG